MLLYRLGFGALQNAVRDQQTEKVRAHIGKGIQLDVDQEGNVWATRLSRNDVIVKGCFEPQKHCISKAVIQTMGHLLQNEPMKVSNDIKCSYTNVSMMGKTSVMHAELFVLRYLNLSEWENRSMSASRDWLIRQVSSQPLVIIELNGSLY